MSSLTLIVIGLAIGTLLLKIRNSFRDALLTSFQIYILAWFIFWCFYGLVYLTKIPFAFLGIHNNWQDYVSSQKWVIHSVIYLLPIFLSLLKGSVSHTNTTVQKSSTKRVVNPVIVPAHVSTNKKAEAKPMNRPINRKNLTEIINNLRKGIGQEISMRDYCDTDISELVNNAGKFGTKLSLKDCYLVSSIRQLANVARNGKGFVYVDNVIEAGSDAEELADKGICFTMDCKNRSTSIKNIVEKAKKANGKIVLINCRNMSSNAISELRSIGKDNIEIK